MRDPSSGQYVHHQLATIYGLEPVDQAAAYCHEETFERLLEMPLNSQEGDLRRHLSSLPGSFEENISHCRDASKDWIPPHAPSYLKELFYSNLNALSELLLDNKFTARSHM